MTKKSPSSIEPNSINHATDGGDWTLTIFLERRRAPIGWVARDAAWTVATEIVVEALNELPSNADCPTARRIAERNELMDIKIFLS
jgi:hypothetical protein